MKKSMRKGLSLVELLVVIVIIGILSAMLILSSAESSASAKASNIISDMTNIKIAALAYLVDHDDEIDKKGTGFDLNKASADVMKYLDKGTVNAYSKYQLVNSKKRGAEDEWYVWYAVTDGRVKKKLAGRAESLNLLGSGSASTGGNLYKSENYVGMQIY